MNHKSVSSMGVFGLEQIRLARGDAAEGVGRAGAGNGALVAMHAAVMADLQEERAVAETITAFDAFGAPDAERLVNRVFVIGVFDERAFDSGGGAELIFSRGGKRIRLWLEVASAEIAVTAHRVGVNAFHGGLFENALCGAIAAADAFVRINLPDPILCLRAIG